MAFATTDLSDARDDARVADPGFRDFGGAPSFWGTVATVKCFEDNSRVREALSEAGEGRVLVVDGRASTRCALLGDQLAAMAVKNGWAGVVVWGCVRDVAALAALPLGVKALASHPRKSVKRGEGLRDVPVRVAGIDIRPGDWLAADADGVLVLDRAPEARPA